MNVFRFGANPVKRKRLTTTFLSDQIQGRKRGWSDNTVSLTGLGEWFFAGVQPKKIEGRYVIHFRPENEWH
ncbi:hypothetical protein J4727_20505 [Providencia rettgeri]|uniref:Uncharacterized protein n=1 Tax=Providencia rettgeri TaxID=587 RepID=A0A939NHE1_PRORE|nr:hypothetical protein [Providencia rettgeri]